LLNTPISDIFGETITMKQVKLIFKNLLNNITIILLSLLALLFIIVGITFYLNNIYNWWKVDSSEFTSSFFTLAGVILYFSALIYQIKEYRLQIEEMRKSVEAQTKSSEALDKQNKILLEQNDKQLILTNINYFNEFKFRNNIDEMMKTLVNDYRILFENDINSIIKNQPRSTKVELNEAFASQIAETFSKKIVEYKHFTKYRAYIQFAYNILYLIDEYVKRHGEKDKLKPMFFNIIDDEENIMLLLSNLLSGGMAHYDNLSWNYPETTKIIGKIAPYLSEENRDLLDIKILTEQFNKLKQQKF